MNKNRQSDKLSALKMNIITRAIPAKETTGLSCLNDAKNSFAKAKTYFHRIKEVGDVKIKSLKDDLGKIGDKSTDEVLRGIDNLTNRSNLLLQIETSLIGLKKREVVINSINSEVKTLNKLVVGNESLSEIFNDGEIPEIDMSEFINKLNAGISIAGDAAQNIKIEIEDLKNDFQEKNNGINIENISAESAKKREEMVKYEDRVKALEVAKSRHDNILSDNKSMLTNLKEEINCLVNKYNGKWCELLNGEGAGNGEVVKKIKDDQINVLFELKVERELFASNYYDKGGSNRVLSYNYSSDKLQNVRDIWNGQVLEALNNFTSKDDVEKLRKMSDCSNDGDKFMRHFADFLQPKYIKMFPNITQDGRNLREMSAGQKNSVLLLITLLSQGDTPIIIDQPENDLDNKFIKQHMVGFLMGLKKHRQIIIVTHNANFVVNADAAQVIVANNKKGIIHYTCGALEDKQIENHICDILEGGKESFERRRSYYDPK